MPVLTDYEVPSEIKRRVKITVNSIHGQYQKQSNIVSNVKEIIMTEIETSKFKYIYYFYKYFIYYYSLFFYYILRLN